MPHAPSPCHCPWASAQLLHLPAAAIACELGCTANHVNVLLRQHGLTCAPAGCGRPAGIRFTPGPEQRAVMEQFQASRALVSGLDSDVGYTPVRLFAELSGRVPMPEQRMAALTELLAKSVRAARAPPTFGRLPKK